MCTKPVMFLRCNNHRGYRDTCAKMFRNDLETMKGFIVRAAVAQLCPHRGLLCKIKDGVSLTGQQKLQRRTVTGRNSILLFTLKAEEMFGTRWTRDASQLRKSLHGFSLKIKTKQTACQSHSWSLCRSRIIVPELHKNKNVFTLDTLLEIEMQWYENLDLNRY